MKDKIIRWAAIIIFIVCFFYIFGGLMGCQEEEADPKEGPGCLTGIEKGTNYPVTIRCCTYKQYLAGSHETSNWTDYTYHKWEKCPACN